MFLSTRSTFSLSNRLRARLVRPGGDVWITHDRTDDEVAHADLAPLVRDFYQRHHAVIGS